MVFSSRDEGDAGRACTAEKNPEKNAEIMPRMKRPAEAARRELLDAEISSSSELWASSCRDQPRSWVIIAEIMRDQFVVGAVGVLLPRSAEIMGNDRRAHA